jgi:hypothetical protein
MFLMLLLETVLESWLENLKKLVLCYAVSAIPLYVCEE